MFIGCVTFLGMGELEVGGWGVRYAPSELFSMHVGGEVDEIRFTHGANETSGDSRRGGDSDGGSDRGTVVSQ